MRTGKYNLLLAACILLNNVVTAQIAMGARGLTIKSGTTFIADSLALIPSADQTIVNNTLTTSLVSSSGTGVPSISRMYSFSNPIFNYSGAIGMFYNSAELNGNTGSWLGISSSYDGFRWRGNRGSIFASGYVQTSLASFSSDSMLKITAVNAVDFYSKPTGDLTVTGTWGINADGSGTCPANFSNTLNKFVLANRAGSVNLTNDWTMMGTLVINSGNNLAIDGRSFVANNINCTGTLGGDRSSALTIKGLANPLHFNTVGNTLGRITLDTGAIAGLGDTLNMTAGTTPGVVAVASGATLNTGGYLRLQSDSNGTARLGTIAGAISGDVICMQYVRGGRRAYRFWAHPFSNYIPLSQIQNYIDITGQGSTANGFTYTASNSPSCYWYHTTVSNSTLGSDPGWKAFTSCYSTVDTNRFKRYQGIRLYIRGKKGEGLGYVLPSPSPVTIGMWGSVNQGNQSIPLIKGSDTTQEYNFIGNPYASPTDIGTVIATARDAGYIRGTAFYVWNPYRGTAGGYEPKTIGSSYSLAANTSFQVRVLRNGGTLEFTENNKTTSAAQVLLKGESQYLALQLYDTNYHPWDIMYFNFNNDCSGNEETNDDAGKLSNPDLNFYSLSSDKHRLSIDTRPFRAGGTVPLGLASGFAQEYIIRVDEMGVPVGGKIYVHDKFREKYMLLETGAEYRFGVTEEMATQGENRFELVMGELSVKNHEAPLQMKLAPNPATDEVVLSYERTGNDEIDMRVVDMAGVCAINRSLGSKLNGNVSIRLDKLPAGIYIVELSAGGKKVSERFVKE